LHRHAGVSVAIGGVTEHLGDRRAGTPSRGDEASCLGSIRVVGRRRGDTEDEIVVMVGEHTGLVAIDPLGGLLRPWRMSGSTTEITRSAATP
jgi:hypothetical protein